MIIVKLFAALKDKAGKDELRIDAASGTVAELLVRISKDHPALEAILSSGRIMVSINREFSRPDAPVKDGDEVALLPPFSGGDGGLRNVRIQSEPFSLDLEIERLKKSSSSIGAIVSFLGTTRDISQGKQVAKLEFEHYPGME